MEPSRVAPRRAALALALALAALGGACAPARPAASGPAPVTAGLPAVPPTRGPLDIRIVHPTPSTPQPRVDSTLLYGSVGTGEARLTIDGAPVEVAPNGAFIAYVPVPASGSYTLIAEARGHVATRTVSYRPAPAAPAAPAPAPVREDYSPARAAVVTGGADTLATGSDVAIGRVSPAGGYRWFLPRGARVSVTARRGELYRARLDSATDAWLPVRSLTVTDSAAATAPTPPRDSSAASGPATPPLPAVGSVEARPAPGWVDVRIAADGVPFLVEAGDSAVEVTLYGVAAPATAPPPADSLLGGVSWSTPAPGSARLRLGLRRPLWGYKAFYEPGGALVVRLRRPPPLSRADPLRGLRVVVDPGHPPAGATGPTGTTEAEANLGVALELARQLTDRGAEVILTRTDSTPVALDDRVRLAADRDAHLLVSVHNNAFAEGVNPFRSHGTSTYYFHPFSAALARALDREIAATTLIPDLGARQGNLALVRPTWMPSALTESLYLPMPRQEAALKDPDFVRRLAAAHVRGIEAFVRGRVGR